MIKPPTPQQALEAAAEGRPLARAAGLPDAALDLAYATAARAYEGGDYASATQGFAMVAALRHTDHRAWLALARSLMATGLPPAACTGYRAALQLAPSGEIWAELARAELAAGDKQAAAEAVAEGRALIGGAKGASEEAARELASLEALLGKEA